MSRASRRQLLNLAAGFLTLPVVSKLSWADTYPSRIVRIIVGFGAGIAPDISARIIAQWLSERLGRQFIVENRTGAAGNVGTELVLHAASDGYTLLLITVVNAINATLYENLNFDFLRDIAPIAGIARVPLVFAVHPSVPATTVPEFIAYAKANPGKINMGSAGNGSVQHVAGELFKTMTGINMMHVPYRNGLVPDLLAGQVQVVFNPLPTLLDFIRIGKLRALAVTSTARLEVLSDVPTLSEFVPGYEAGSWYGIGAPKNTPPEIIERLGGEITAALASPAIKTRFVEMGAEPMPLSPAAFGKLLVNETQKWGKVIKEANIKSD
jgi:tripartite-type tricarboxylate transporter receptor subunit TctC